MVSALSALAMTAGIDRSGVAVTGSRLGGVAVIAVVCGPGTGVAVTVGADCISWVGICRARAGGVAAKSSCGRASVGIAVIAIGVTAVIVSSGTGIAVPPGMCADRSVASGTVVGIVSGS